MPQEIIINKLPVTLEVSVRFGREGRLRMWIVSQLFKLAGWVMSGVAKDIDYGTITVSQRQA